jgi:hypothetical protein
MFYHNRDDFGFRMRLARLPRAALGLGAAAVIGVLGPASVRGAESWQILLTHQLKEQQRCILNEVLFVNEVRVGERVGLVGRIRCSDAREYDFEREQTNQNFVIRLCQPAVC